MVDDPIVEEVRKVRQELFEQCGCDLERFMEFIRQSQANHGGRVITSLQEKKEYFGESTSVSADAKK